MANAATQFKPGHKLSPGRPMGSRQRIGEALIPMFGALLEAPHAKQALLNLLIEEPGKFFTIAAGLMPRTLEAFIQSQTNSSAFTNEERHAIRGVLDAIEAAGAQGIEPAQCFAMIEHALRSELAKPILAAPPPL